MTACNKTEAKNDDNGKLKIISTLFPQYDFARQIAGDKADVSLLLPPGTESHSFDPKPGDIVNIYNADLFIYTGKNMEPWTETIIKGVKNTNLLIVDCSKNIELLTNDDENEDAHDSEDSDHGADAHIWLDPTLCVKMVDNILEALCEKDGANLEYYTANADEYKKKLRKLDEDIFDAIKNAGRDTVVFGGRFAYIYFLNHFGLKYVTAYDSCSSSGEPSVAKIAYVIDFIKENKIPCIYHEELADPKVAKSIAEAANIDCLLFSTAHNLTKGELESGVTFLDIMYSNLDNLKKGLN